MPGLRSLHPPSLGVGCGDDGAEVRTRGARLVCGIFDWEDHATLLWWRGRGLDVELPQAEMDLAEVE